MTNYQGIDYGRGETNIDKKTGIRYGVLHQGDVLQAWADDSEPFYVFYCPYCSAELKRGYDAKRCPGCYKKIDPDMDFMYTEPVSFFYKKGDYLCEQSIDDPDIFIMKSPYFTYAKFCSPCAPGACYLSNPLDEPNDNNKCYCFDHSWFEDGQAPYPVYSVKTGKQIVAEKQQIACQNCNGTGRYSVARLAEARGVTVDECLVQMKDQIKNGYRFRDFDGLVFRCFRCDGAGYTEETVIKEI